MKHRLLDKTMKMLSQANEVNFLTIDEIIAYHDSLIKDWGGLKGIRDKDLLESTLKVIATNFRNESLYTQACLYLQSLIKDHYFNDGNKRTGIYCAIQFLTDNSIDIESVNELLLEDLAIAIANNEIHLDGIKESLWKAIQL